jgi:hypothetical protein
MALIVAVVLMPITAIAQEKHKVPNRKVLQAFGKLDKALAIEAESLQKNNQAKQAQEILSLQKTVADVVAVADNPGECAEMRRNLFVEKMIGRWQRSKNPNTYEIFRQGNDLVLTEKNPKGDVRCKGVVMVRDENIARVTFDRGHEWTIFETAGNRLAIEETLGDEFSNDGIVLSRNTR